jgi:mRNA-degrading endonuclease toxin of MazEF toxin-antitoxin module
VIRPGDVVPRCDSDHELYVLVLSNSIHLAAGTGRVVACPFIPGPIPEAEMAMVVEVGQPDGVVLPELVQWLPAAALDESIGNVGVERLAQARAIVSALIS